MREGGAATANCALSHGCRYERCRKVILPVCSRLEGHHIDQTFGIMDVTGQ